MSDNNTKQSSVSTKEVEKIYAVVLPNDVLLEAIRPNPREKPTLLVWKDGKAELVDKYTDQETGVVNSAIYDTYVKKGSVRLPSGADGPYEPRKLMDEVRAILHAYMDLDPGFEEIAARYVLLTYVTDCVDKVPYLRVLGLSNTGKSRFLQIMGSLVYHPINLGAGVSAPNVFRMSDHVPMGVPLMDEVNIADSGMTSPLVQVLNNGYQRDGIVTRSDGKKYEPAPYRCFGCKILAAHRPYDDPGLESRFFTQVMTGCKRRDLLLALPAYDAWQEAEGLRKRLLNFRLHFHAKLDTNLQVPQLEKFDRRVQEIATPLFQITGEDPVSKAVFDFLSEHTQVLQNTNRNTFDGLIAEAVVQMAKFSQTATFGEIKQQISINTGFFPSSKKIGDTVRTMGFTVGRNGGGVYVYLRSIDPKSLSDRFGIQLENTFSRGINGD